MLSGCQLLVPHSQVDAVTPMAAKNHVQSVQLIDQQMDRYLNQDGRELFLSQVMVALESDSRTKFKGKDPETFSWWKIRVKPKQWKSAEITSLVDVGVDISHSFEFMDVTYRSKTTLNFLAKPSLTAQVLGTLSKDEAFNVIAKVEGEPWLLAEQNGAIKGYVHEEYVRSHVVNRDILSIKPNPLLASSAKSMDAQTVNEIFGRYTCRDLSYELTKDDDIATASFRACRKQRKIWYIDVPMIGTNQP
ncbi:MULTISPECIES: SH3 domain-containing protein [Vibrio]|jgi:hypothetical protein|uniref:SH3 domain-containing protein n=1 Tax=Vibrio TaxID=662 RepID=UPI000E69FE9D|nr:SH3 domain-containing protein [Vibrio sp. PID23_8]RIZ54576.1 hypothetical protein AK966_09130 [Vibrio sp. PID23_8]